MPAMICSITKDESCEDNFIVRMYREPKEIGMISPVDSWECRGIYVDKGTLDYLNDRVIVDFLTRRGKMMEKFVRWLIKKFLKGYHLHKDPAKTTAFVNFPEVKDGQQ